MLSIASRRLGRLERAAVERHLERFREAERTLLGSLADEHLEILRAWSELPDARRAFDGPPIPLAEAFARLEAEPPPLVRAAFELILWAANTGAAQRLPPEWARVYVEEPDAWARDLCAACGSLWPVRARRGARGRLIVLGSYCSRCPRCGGDEIGHIALERFPPVQAEARK